MLLSDLKTGEQAVVVRVAGYGGFRRRIMEMGFVRGQSVKVLLNAPLKDPIKYLVMGYEVSLRGSEAAMIEVESEKQARHRTKRTNTASLPEGGLGDPPPAKFSAPIQPNNHEGSGLMDGASSEGADVGQRPDQPFNIAEPEHKTINIALVGNPNSGKTSLFNAASGAHEHVGNYGGVTVDAKRGRIRHGGYTFNIWDLPGTYSLSAYSPEEVYVREHIVRQRPDVVVNVVAASNLERNLFLTTELIEMNCSPVVMALNMFDELQASGAKLDYKALGGQLGVPIVPTNARVGQGVGELFDRIIAICENRDDTVRHIHIAHTQEFEEGIDTLRSHIVRGTYLDFSPRWLAIKLLERDKEVERLFLDDIDMLHLRDREVERIERTVGEDVESIATNDKYGFISGALKENFVAGASDQVHTTRAIDALVTNKLFGFPIFLFLMWLMFECTFRLGAYPMEWIESGVGALGEWIGRVMPEGMLKDMLVDGVIGGVGGVIVFLPNILILYLFISFMEDSGYMARAAFIMDKLMHRMGLHGKSFIPLIMGFGCGVPAIMATRTIESRSSRLITILVNPFMSCSARLPIYVLLTSIFFPKHAGLVMMGLYLGGIVVAVVTAKMLRKFFFRRDETPFVMELPPYRVPTWRSTLIHMWEKAWQYLNKMGGIILAAALVVWFLSYFPRNEELSESEQMRESYIGHVGRAVEPVLRPMDMDWKASVALVTGAAAKEIVVSTLGVLDAQFAVDEEGDPVEVAPEGRLFVRQPASEANLSGTPVAGGGMTARTALAFMVFTLLYFPCLAALTAIAREAGGWRYAAFSFIYNTLIAWVLAYAVFQIWGWFM